MPAMTASKRYKAGVCFSGNGYRANVRAGLYLAYTAFVLLSGLFLLLLYILFVLEKQVEAVANVNETRQNYHK